MSGFVPEGAGADVGEVVPVPAASTIVLRDGAPFEVLLVRRNESSSFVPSAWVFPGGAVDESDRQAAEGEDILSTMRRCAHRELFEETGIWLGSPPADLLSARDSLLDGSREFLSILREGEVHEESFVYTARWITPKGIPKRFDTWFFLAHVEPDVEAVVDAREVVEALWLDPHTALDRNRRGEMAMVLPTIRNLEALLQYPSIHALFEARRSATIETVEPVLIVEGGKKRIVIPGEER